MFYPLGHHFLVFIRIDTRIFFLVHCSQFLRIWLSTVDLSGVNLSAYARTKEQQNEAM
jgi:hypothetical protein